MIEAEQLHARILARLDMTRDMEDEELTELIYEVLQEVSQEEYLKLRNAFETAEANLVEKDAAKPEQPKPDKPQQDQKPDSDDKHEVHTGDTTESSLPMAWLLASVVAVGGILISKKKRVK